MPYILHVLKTLIVCVVHYDNQLLYDHVIACKQMNETNSVFVYHRRQFFIAIGIFIIYVKMYLGI